ncbi:transferase [Sistotremastrum niveocremeum HHB9708]|uniref:Phosphatidylinositol N-acetylglucosaminyltransferase GPI3 subunit n=2 Tax=Sistotremastraceae TaxID=3402574 RepID=A0A164YR89_9AGAM|nr:transferase [Sistotremastrum niveocremeum HHB9708]KZT41594.1 glycosyltransferase family 4 protein [Sistotremastrum suecicum HHB10207 ss-3]
MPINIAMVSDFFHPNIGGVENHIYMLSVELIKRGHKVIVITHSHPPDRVGIRWLVPGVKVYHVPFPTIASSATLPNFLTFLPYLRNILLREHIHIVHGHASLSSLAHEAVMHAHLMGVRTCFTDHSLFGFDDAAGILTNKLLEGALRNVDAVICVSHTGRENTVLRAALSPSRVYVIPNAVVAERFTPPEVPQTTDIITIVVISRLAYRKGVDLLVATAPRICQKFPQVRFLIGGDGPKVVELHQMREKYLLQDRIELLGSVRHGDVPSVLQQGSIFLNTSLTEAFGIGILEAACAGLYVVSTKVGGVPEVLPSEMISFALPEEDDVVSAISEAVQIVTDGRHDPAAAHNRIRTFYNWPRIAARTEKVYSDIQSTEPIDLITRMQRVLSLGPFFGPIQLAILVVDCIFFLVLEWWYPRENIDYVKYDWDIQKFEKLYGLDRRNAGVVPFNLP